jgi:hypothetical protein
MNERHEAIARVALPPLEVNGDPRDGFARIAARCLAVLEEAGETVDLPQRDPTPTWMVLGVHAVDMLVHRWDLARAIDNLAALLGRDPDWAPPA